MKKIIMLSLALLMGVATMTAAESITSNSFNIMSGETKTFSISLTNDRTDYVSFQMDLTLPAHLSLNKANCSLSSRFNSGELTIGKQGDNTYRLTATSFSLTPISGTSGGLITLSVTGQQGFTGGTATITNIRFATTNSQRVTMADASFNITRPAATVVTAPTPKTLTYTGAALQLVNAGVASGGTMQYSINGTTYSTSIPTGTNAGSYTVYYKVVGDANHTDTAPATVSVTIQKAASAVTTAPTAKTLSYTGAAQQLVNAGVASGGTMQYSLDGTAYSTNIPTGISIGSYTVYYKVVGDANHTDTAPATVSVTIQKAASAVTTAPTAKTLTYTGAAQQLVNAGVASGGTMQYSINGTTYGTAIPTGTNAGTYTVYYKVVGDANHTDTAPATVSVTIQKAASAFTTAPTAKTLTYTGAAQQLVNAGVAYEGTMQYSLDGTTYGTSIPTGTNAGSYTVYYKVVGDANHTDTTPATVSVTIQKAASAVTTAPTAKTLTYTGAAQQLVNAGVAYEGTMQYSLDGTTYGTAIPTGTNAGTYTVYYKVVGDANHTDTTPATVSVTIQKAAAAVTTAPTAKTLVYTGAAQQLVNAGVASGGTMQYSLNGTTYGTAIPTGTNVGTYTVYYKVVGDANHSDTTPATVSVSIKKAAAAVTTAPTAKTLTYTGSAQQLVNAGAASGGTMQYSIDNKTYGTSIPTGTNAGTYTVYYKVVGDANHTDTTPATVSVSIKKAAAAVTTAPTAKSLTYTGSAQQLVNAGVASGGTMQYSIDNKTYGTSIPTGTNAGSYTVYYKVVGDANHSDTTPATVSVTIQKAASAVTTAPTAKTLTYTGGAQQLVNAGVASGGTMQYSIDNKTYGTSIPTGTNAGTYTVYYKVVGDDNHSDTTPATVSVTIQKAASAVTTAPTAKTLVYTGSAQLLVNAGVASGGTMQYSIDNKTYGTSIPTGTNAGTYTVYYKVVGDTNHTDTAPATVSVTIQKAASAVTTVPTAKTLVYTGEAQQLVNAGAASGGTMQYSLNGTTYSTAIPTGTNAGTYTVYYKVVGDANHTDTEPATVSVTIKEPQGKKGDVNGDGVVDVADIASIIDVMAKDTNDAKADVNGDGSVDVADIATVIDIMAASARRLDIDD